MVSGEKMKKRQVLKKLLDVPNIHAMMNSGEETLRSALIKKIMEVRRPVLPAEIPQEWITPDLPLSTTMQNLADKGLLVFNDKGAISGVYPVSALMTRHTVRLQDGRSLHAMCAIDSLGTAFEFGQDLTITSSCRQCDTNITMHLENGKLTAAHPATTHALHVDIQKYKDWAASC
jgi:hypothetical protein